MKSQLDTLRTVMRDALFGRTKIRVVEPVRDELVTPVFILGTFRSGTTLLRYMLDSHRSICCPPETKFLVHLSELKASSSTWQSLESIGLEECYIRKSIAGLATNFYSPYLLSKKKQVIVDKTPDYVGIIDFIDWLYQRNVQYILIFRNGLDVTQSMCENFIEPLEGHKTVDTAFKYWQKDTEQMLKFLEENSSRCHKIVYDDLCDNTEKVMMDLLAFMGLPWDSSVLEWHTVGHDRGLEDKKARRQIGVQKSTAGYSSWSPELIEKYKCLSSELHRIIGFDPDTLEYR